MADNSVFTPDQWEVMRNRLFRFGLSMVVMAACFILYYLGFFGTYQGPLNPGNLGRVLGGLGVEKAHVAWLFIGLFVVLLTWNWVFNLVSLLKGSRHTCLVTRVDGHLCGAGVCREKNMDAAGSGSVRFVCANGHVSSRADFHPIRKGPWSYCLCLAMALISGMCIYWI